MLLLYCSLTVPAGLGIAKLLVSVLFSVHFAVMLGWYGYYFVVSFFDPLPWAECKQEWSSASQSGLLRAITTTELYAYCKFKVYK